MHSKNLFEKSPSSPSMKVDPAFPTNPFLFSPIILILVATLLILGFLVGLSCRNNPQSSINQSNSRQTSRRDSFQNNLIFREKNSDQNEDALSIGIDFTDGRKFKFHSARKDKSNKRNHKFEHGEKKNHKSLHIDEIRAFKKKFQKTSIIM